MQNWKSITSISAIIFCLAGCSKQEETPPAPPAPEPKNAEPSKPSPLPTSPRPAAVQPKTQMPGPSAVSPGSSAAQTAAALENAYVSNPDFSARVETIYKITDAGTPEAISSLGRLFHMEKDPDLKTEMLDALFDIDGQDEAKAALLSAGASADQPKDVRQSAIEGLEDVKPELALPILKALASDPDADISESAKDAIETLQDQQANPAQMK